MVNRVENTMKFRSKELEVNEVSKVLNQVFRALRESDYDPVDQLVGYLISGDPAYITSQRDARILIRRLERDVILEELVRKYLEREGL
ncbi:MAG: IreB family regulatory phosphoprotein [Bacteroidota bacterium]